jgi:hypothetical protein
MVKAAKIWSLASILLLVVMAISALPAYAVPNPIPCSSEVWVAKPPVGSDGNPGTQNQPFGTIQHGINAVCVDGTVHVAAGTYFENLEIGKSLDMIGSGAPTTIIDGGGNGRVLHISSYRGQTNTISGFTIQNGHIRSGTPGMPIGGGVYVTYGHIVTLEECTIKNNVADFLGGGIYNAGQTTLIGCTVNGNSTPGVGGGIANFVVTKQLDGDGSMSMFNCTISGNSAGQQSVALFQNPDSMPEVTLPPMGGGVFNGADMDLVNVTIANNTVFGNPPHGGGFASIPLWCTNPINTIFVPGTEAAAGSIIYTPVSTFSNTIVANNVPDNGYNNGGIVHSAGYNLDSGNSCGFNQSTDKINTDPKLGPLADNGGPTFTQALLHGSPAIDAIVTNCTIGFVPEFQVSPITDGHQTCVPQIDQRDVPRPQGPAYDIGAYELAQDSAVTTTNVGTASFSTVNGYITDLTALDPSQTGCGTNPPGDFPFGLFSLNVKDITPGSTATIVIILPTNAPIGTQYWKCINGNWVNCTSLLGSDDGDQVLTLSITDGGLGDSDGLINGQISDPGGPAEPSISATQSRPRTSPALPRPLNPPQISVQYLNVIPKQATANQPVTISTNVVNTGDQGGNLNVALKINGKIEQTRMVSVGPQASQPVKFTVTKAQPGTYSIDVAGQTATFTIPDAQANNARPVNSSPIILLILGVLGLAAIMLLVFRHRQA